MITKEILEQYREQQRKNKILNRIPQPMFKDGIFNPNNWNGGDDLIRYFFIDINLEEKDINLYYMLKSGKLSIMHYCANNQIYAVFIHDKYSLIWNDEKEREYDIYFFSWYKKNGTINIAMYNSDVMNEVQYIRLLNLIVETGYKFPLV